MEHDVLLLLELMQDRERHPLQLYSVQHLYVFHFIVTEEAEFFFTGQSASFKYRKEGLFLFLNCSVSGQRCQTCYKQIEL